MATHSYCQVGHSLSNTLRGCLHAEIIIIIIIILTVFSGLFFKFGVLIRLYHRASDWWKPRSSHWPSSTHYPSNDHIMPSIHIQILTHTFDRIYTMVSSDSLIPKYCVQDLVCATLSHAMGAEKHPSHAPLCGLPGELIQSISLSESDYYNEWC